MAGVPRSLCSYTRYFLLSFYCVLTFYPAVPHRHSPKLSTSLLLISQGIATPHRPQSRLQNRPSQARLSQLRSPNRPTRSPFKKCPLFQSNLPASRPWRQSPRPERSQPQQLPNPLRQHKPPHPIASPHPNLSHPHRLRLRRDQRQHLHANGLWR